MQRKRILAFLTAVCLVCALIPATATAAGKADLMGNADKDVKMYSISNEAAKKKDLLPDKEKSAATAYEVVEKPNAKNDNKAAKIMAATSDTSGNCGENGSNVTWHYDSDAKCLTLSGSGKMQDYSGAQGIPWSDYAGSITAIQIGEGITYLGEAAFYNCRSITEITFPQTVKSTGKATFANCSNLKAVTLNEGLESLPYYVFQNCAVDSICLPDSLNSVSALTFFNCGNLEEVQVSGQSPYYTSENGVLLSKDKKKIILYPQGKSDTAYAVPNSVEVIGEYAFSGASNLRSITLTANVKQLEDGAMIRSGIETLDLPNSVTSIGQWICQDCFYLKSVTIGSGLKALNYQAFQSCGSLTSVSLGSSLTDLDYMAFAYCGSLEEIKIPNGVTAIKNGTFGECTSLKQVTLPTSLEEIWYQAFLNCSSLKTVSLPAGLKTINRLAFYGTDLSEVVIPKQVTLIGEEAFPDTAKLNITNPNLVLQADGSYLATIPVTVSAVQQYKETFQVLDLVNQEREKQNLSHLKMDQSLLNAAMLRAAELSIYFSHTRPTGQDCFSANSKMRGENIAVGQGSAASVMNSWMNSSGHRANILGANYQSIGIGSVKVDGQLYWVQCFGSEAATEANVSAYQNQTRNVTVQITENDEEFHPELMAESSMRVGESQTAEFVFANGFCYTSINPNYITFDSTDNKACKISDQGKISGLSAGKSVIKAYLKGYPQISASENISIIAIKSVKVSKVTISGNSKKIAAGKKVKLTAKVSPSNVENKKVKWTSSNTKVATVNSSGVVTIKKGSGGKSATITATATDGSGKKAVYKITAMKGIVKKVAISGKKAVKAGKSVKLIAKVTASKNANKTVKWTSSNKKYATVDSKGKVTARKAGKGKSVKITAMATDGSGKKKAVTIKIQ